MSGSSDNGKGLVFVRGPVNCFTVFACRVPSADGGELVMPPMLQEGIPVQPFNGGHSLLLGTFGEDLRPCFIPLSPVKPPAIFLHGRGSREEVSQVKWANLATGGRDDSLWFLFDNDDSESPQFHNAVVFVHNVPFSAVAEGVERIRWVKGAASVFVMPPGGYMIISGHHILLWENGKMTLEIDS